MTAEFPSPEGKGKGWGPTLMSGTGPSDEGQTADARVFVADSGTDQSPGEQSRPERTGPRSRADSRPASAISVDRARELRRAATPQERKLWRQLRLLRPAGLHFRRQVPIGRYVVDFACLKQRIVVEIDGGQHSFDAYAARDRTRDETLTRLGFRVKRFWNAEVNSNLDGVVETILATAGLVGGGPCERVEGAALTSVAPVPIPALHSGEGDSSTLTTDSP
jgi:very-short-patch-repair endonuclease